MEFRTFQAQVAEWQQHAVSDHADPHVKACKLAEEAGEVCGAVVKSHEDPPRRARSAVAKEIVDVLTCVAGLAALEGIDLQEAIDEFWTNGVQLRDFDAVHSRSTEAPLDRGTRVRLDGDLVTTVVDAWDDIVQLAGLDKAVERSRVEVID